MNNLSKIKRNSPMNWVRIIVLGLLCLVAHEAYSQTFEAKVDSILQDKFQAYATGAVFLVAQDGSPAYRKALGKANIELDVDMNPESVFKIGSMTKQFTAVAILMLAENEKLSLDDDITQFIPDYPTHGESITIHQLLTHTSGIKNFTEMKSIMTIAQKDLSPKELIDFFKDEPMVFKPGEEFKYSNSSYVILGYIIELVSGMSYEDFIEKNIFQKLGMNDSRYATDREIVQNRAYGYQQTNDGYVNKRHISFNITYSAGSLMSTVDDLLKWQEALNSNELLSPETTRLAFTNYELNNGEKIDYGYGWHLKSLNDMSVREHGGSIFGFKSMAVYIPERDIYVVGLTNCDCVSPTQLVRDIAVLAAESL
ncbi:serine hydrolase domain-containing protein [Sunxiuqinia elliptica]|nr:serine hydrolase domain-containing protein [Sunxiuqinia elliptica]